MSVHIKENKLIGLEKKSFKFFCDSSQERAQEGILFIGVAKLLNIICLKAVYLCETRENKGKLFKEKNGETKFEINPNRENGLHR